MSNISFINAEIQIDELSILMVGIYILSLSAEYIGKVGICHRLVRYGKGGIPNLELGLLCTCTYLWVFKSEIPNLNIVRTPINALLPTQYKSTGLHLQLRLIR